MYIPKQHGTLICYKCSVVVVPQKFARSSKLHETLHRITVSGTVRFLPILESSWSPIRRSNCNQAYLSIRQTSSRGMRTETNRLRQRPSFEVAGFPLCSALSRPWGRCGGKSEPKISVIYFLRVEWRERVGFNSQTGRCAAVFSLTRTHTALSDRRRTAMTSRSSSRLWGRMAGSCKLYHGSSGLLIAYWRNNILTNV